MIIKMTGSEARSIVHLDAEGWSQLIDDIVDNSRWSTHHHAIHKRESDGKLFAFNYSVGATESQDESPYEYENDVDIHEVVAKEVVKTEYVLVKDVN